MKIFTTQGNYNYIWELKIILKRSWIATTVSSIWFTQLVVGYKGHVTSLSSACSGWPSLWWRGKDQRKEMNVKGSLDALTLNYVETLLVYEKRAC